jgi:hypothetical protein
MNIESRSNTNTYLNNIVRLFGYLDISRYFNMTIKLFGDSRAFFSNFNIEKKCFPGQLVFESMNFDKNNNLF